MIGGLAPGATGPALAAGTMLAILAVVGATLALSTREARLAVIGLLVTLLAAPFIADPLPDLRGIAARIVGAALATYPLLVAARVGIRTAGSRNGWAGDALLALTGGIAAVAAMAGADLNTASGGLGLPSDVESAGLLASPFLPAVGAGAALLVLAAGPVAAAREPLRLAVGLTIGLLGLTLLQAGIGGPPSAFTNLCNALLLAVVAAAGWALSAAAAKPGRRTETTEPVEPSRRPQWPSSARASSVDRQAKERSET